MAHLDWQKLKAEGVPVSLAIAAMFFLISAGILMLRQDVVPYRPEQPIPHDIVSRVGFDYRDPARLAVLQRQRYEREPRVYQPNPAAWDELQKDLLALPEKVASSPGEVPADLRDLGIDNGTATALRNAASPEGKRSYDEQVTAFVQSLRQSGEPLILLRDAEWQEDAQAHRKIRIGPSPADLIDLARTWSLGQKADLRRILRSHAELLPLVIRPAVVEFALAHLQPTYTLDEDTTLAHCKQASEDVSPLEAKVHYRADEILVHKSKRNFDQQDVQLLRTENAAYLAQVKGSTWKPLLGTACLVLIVTVVMCAYIWYFQPRVVKNHARAFAIVALMLSMLLLAQLAGIGNGPIFLLGVAPTILVGMILTIAYDQRFSMGVASMHGLLVTVALGQGVTFFVILWVGVLTACFLMDDIRTRSKLVEVGGASALAMMAAAAAAGLLDLESPSFVLRNCLYTGAAGLAVGFIVLGILPFVERAFRITTSMTLLELADMDHPLLRRLSVEAPGTYNHSLNVATLAKAAAEAVGADALLCRVASYYHDVGKINKPDYFVENQAGGENRHLTLTPSMSLTIIKNHVKDGVALAREYNLPSSVIPFIEQHHGTTLIEYFFHRAVTKAEEEQQQVPPGAPAPQAPADHDFRYDGPKPRSRETAIVMVADAVESATRAMSEPDYSRVERLVHDLSMKRLLDGQFDECDLTMRDLERVERALIKTLLSAYHGRIQYPSTAATTAAPTQPPPQAPPPAPAADGSADRDRSETREPATAGPGAVGGLDDTAGENRIRIA